ncbi:hypothetical protein SRHO_G00131010 [Serrasalmus rhombeus]
MASQRTYTAKEVLAILTNVDSCESDGGEELSRTYEITSDSSDEDTSCASDEVIQSPPRKRQTTSAPSIRAKDGTVWEKVDITRTRVSCLPNSTFSEPAGPTEHAKGERVSENVVMKLMKPYLGKGRTVATDNYFTSLSLANRLLESNTTLLGTINKIRREIPLEAKNAKGREKLSTEVYRSDGALLTVYAPKTNKTVCVLSTMHTHVKIADDRKRKPNTCAVDIMDQKVRAYTVRAGTRRWPVAVFYNLLDLAAMNTHVLYTACTGSTESRRVFLCALAEELRHRYLQEKELRKTPRPLPAPGKKTQCQVQSHCNRNHSINPCAACGKAPACPAVTSTPSLFSTPGTSVSVCLDINTSSAPTDIHQTPMAQTSRPPLPPLHTSRHLI